MDRPEDSPTAYEHSLDIWPARYNSLLGAARAASHYRTLLETVDREKAEREGVREALRVVGS